MLEKTVPYSFSRKTLLLLAGFMAATFAVNVLMLELLSPHLATTVICALASLLVTAIFGAAWFVMSGIVATERTIELSRTNADLEREMHERLLTERQRDHLMDELVNHVRFLQTLIDAIPNPVFFTDASGLYLGCNRAFEEQWNLSREEIVGKTVYELFRTKNAEDIFQNNTELVTRGGTSIHEMVLELSDSCQHSVIFYNATYKDTSGATAGLVGTIIDITKRKKAEDDRDRLMHELQRKNKELAGIVYVISHDLRSPLINIQGFSRKLAKQCAAIVGWVDSQGIDLETEEILRHSILDEIPKALGFITSSVEKMDLLLSGLLRLSRLGRAALILEPIDMQALINSIVETMTFQLEAAEARITIGEMVRCTSDKTQITQIFSNLMDNAIKFRAPDHKLEIHIDSRAFDHGVRYCIEDNGIGVPPEQQEKIWEIFHRLNPAKTSGEGLGLTMVRAMVDRLGGSIWIESDGCSGSRFYIVLPTAASDGLHALAKR